jgi:hypothetical protein
MSLPVGIHDNIVITKTTKNDKGSLVIGVKQVGDVDPMTALNASGSITLDQKEQDFLIFPPRLEDNQGQTDTKENLLKKIAEVKDPLDRILQQYTTTSNIKWDILAGTGLTNENFETRIKTQAVIDKIYANIVEQFIKQMTPYVGETGKKMRMLFIRQSKAKHFPKLRTRFLDSYPFIEPMTVPTSKLKYSKYELDNGLNIPDPVTGESVVSKEDATTAAALFAKTT